MEKNWSALLARSLDEQLSPEDEQLLAKALAESADLRREREQLVQLRQWVQQAAPTVDPDFADKVMARMPAVQFGAKVVALFPKIAAACALIFALTLGVLYSSEAEWVDDEVVGVETLQPEDAHWYLSEELTMN